MTDAYLYDGQGQSEQGQSGQGQGGHDGYGEHVRACPACSAAVALLGWPGPAVAPPDRLREAVLSGARRRRAPAEPLVAEVAAPYAEQVALMDDLLAGLTAAQWEAPIARHGTVRGMIEHLAANDARVAVFMGVPGPAAALPAHRRWRTQAGSLLERVSAGREALLGAEVELAGARRERGPLRHALVQRTFETWTHADDIRALTDRPAAPPPDRHVRMIAEFGLAVLPGAVRGKRRDAATFVLTGAAGGTWTVPLSPAADRVTVLISADLVAFCRLLAGRWPPGSFPYAAEGDPALARELVRAAATLGCDG
ncbi:hypothetical protein [Nonomuraea sp. SBT364]|uniref:hypothetical protein n=1 Tax=Nonomuraea sp. SBT364 TaxID=1580530 RepID=UPI00066B0E88|nr:hypothetical protein [Nonomuraea sp. SBT364]